MIDQHLYHDISFAEAPGGVPVLTAYKDTQGYWTIGIGHLLVPITHNWWGYTITAEEAIKLLDADIITAQGFAGRLPEWKYLDTTCRQNAVVELCFNLGPRWLDFHETRDAIMARDWQKAHDQLLASEWAVQVGPTRSNRLANYLLTGQYPA
jgi:lysozyme